MWRIAAERRGGDASFWVDNNQLALAIPTFYFNPASDLFQLLDVYPFFLRSILLPPERLI